MGYYSVFILKRVRNTGHSDAYQPESAYFGESENMVKEKTTKVLNSSYYELCILPSYKLLVLL